ncbi:NAD(P)H-binding protein, partial [Staphylococcus saprophyticus]|uniref:NAD(P)H-binding protein n=1 Tax=Staphylococcus saprophyticus TaxID=29385 RepID=UPI00370490EE
MEDVHILLPSLSPQLHKEPHTILHPINPNNLKTLIFLTSIRIYNELPANFRLSLQDQITHYLLIYTKPPDIIQQTHLHYTIFRPPCLTHTNQ